MLKQSIAQSFDVVPILCQQLVNGIGHLSRGATVNTVEPFLKWIATTPLVQFHSISRCRLHDTLQQGPGRQPQLLSVSLTNSRYSGGSVRSWFT